MMAYGQLYHCPNVMLLYPHHIDLPEEPILQDYTIASKSAQEKLFLATVDISGSRPEHRKALSQMLDQCLSLIDV